MARFGYETKGANYHSIRNNMQGSKFTCTESGTADSITGWLETITVGNAKCAIYDSDLNLVGVTEERTLDVVGQWQTFNFTAPKPSLSAADYWLVAWSTCYSYLYYDGGAANQGADYLKTYNSFPDPLVPDAYFDEKMSIYCDYTPTVVGWTGKISGVTNPAKVMGVDVANIAKVKGIP